MATIFILRRSGKTFSPIGVGEKVLPGEAIQIKVTRTGSLARSVVFTIEDEIGEVVFRASAAISLLGEAWLNIAAPEVTGPYILKAAVPLARDATISFEVSTLASPPPTEPPTGGFLTGIQSVTNLLLVGGIAILAIGAISTVKKFT